jgi:TatD DNase family protein
MNPRLTFLDAHLHLQRFSEPGKVIAAMKSAGICHCVVNGTNEEDWPQVAALAEEFTEMITPAFGLHPWWAGKASADWLEKLTHYLDRFPNAALGECGVDGWTQEVSLEQQMEVFLPQLRLARERDLPVVIHSLKAWEPLFSALTAEPPSTCGFLLHSYGGSAEMIPRLVKQGAWFSCSGYFLQPRKAKVLEAFQQVPRDRLLLETDAPDMLPPDKWLTYTMPDGENHPANLPGIAAGLAQHWGMTPDALAHLTTTNARRFFRIRMDL